MADQMKAVRTRKLCIGRIHQVVAHEFGFGSREMQVLSEMQIAYQKSLPVVGSENDDLPDGQGLGKLLSNTDYAVKRRIYDGIQSAHDGEGE